MTVLQLLQSKDLELSLYQKGKIGERIKAKFLTTGKTPTKVKSKEGEFEFVVNDYPEDWMIVKGWRVVENYLKTTANV